MDSNITLYKLIIYKHLSKQLTTCRNPGYTKQISIYKMKRTI